MTEPLVSIVTPAYNAAPFIRQCIESALAQSYRTIEHIIVDNASTDDTRAIAEGYARHDPRVRVVTRDVTVPFVQNWNSAVEAISPDARYCHTLHADDWLYPACIEKMTALAERDPSVGAVGSLRLRGEVVQCGGLPAERSIFAGREIARMFMRGEVFAMAPTTNMIRADIVRARRPFYPDAYLHADIAAYLGFLADTNFAFCHEVLTFSRTHDASITQTVAERKRTFLREWPMLMAEYGHRYFSDDEREILVRKHLRHHHRVILRSMLTGAGPEFLRFHLDGMRKAGHKPTLLAFIRAAADEVAGAVMRPDKAMRHVQRFLLRGWPKPMR